MKKTTLLSVILVVVLVASLATATFAWFTMNTTVNANTINMTAVTTRDLKISLDDNPANFDYKIDFNADLIDVWPTTLTDVDAGAGTVEAILELFKQAKTSTTIIPTGSSYAELADEEDLWADAVSDNVIIETFYLLASQQMEVELTTESIITATGAGSVDAALLGAVRLALFDATGKVIAIWAPNADYTTNTYGETTYAASANVDFAGADNFVSQTGGTLETAITLDATLSANAITQYFVAIWIEGADPEAVNANSGLEFNITLQFAEKAII